MKNLPKVSSVNNQSKQTTSFRLSSFVIMLHVPYRSEKSRISDIVFWLSSIFLQTSSQKYQSMKSNSGLCEMQNRIKIIKASSKKSHKMKQALWSYKDILRTEACIIFSKDSPKVNRARSYGEGFSEMKSRRRIINRFSTISLAELLDGNGSAAAEAPAPARTSSKVIGSGSAGGCR